jgi:CRP/FNR family cyclic AMP-dependent transcriptional regulator
MSRFRTSPARGGHWRRISLIDADPELASGLDEHHRADARRTIVVPEFTPSVKAWNDNALDRLVAGGIGVLLVEGVLARELVLSDNVTTEILGPGDLLVPSHMDDPDRLLRSAVRWTVIEPTAFALLGAEAATALGAYPPVYAQLLGRVAARAHRLSVAQAISQLNGVDRRILTLLWQLAERWGHVRPDGVHVPLRLPHRIVAQLVGARRPTVSTAVTTLVRQGHVRRLDDGGWLLIGEPVGLPVGEASRVVHMRHRRLPVGASMPSTAG